MEEKVLFDPGFAPFVQNFSYNIESIYEILAQTSSVHQKKFKFKMMQKNISALVKNNTAFYLGCLLWAYYLSTSFENSPKEIADNSFYGLSSEKIKEYDFDEEINFIILYFDKYKKDTAYYIGKNDSFPDEWLKILKIYKEFLILNNSFINVKYTSDIQIPETFKNLKFDFDIKDLINFSLENKNIENLLTVNIFA